MWILKLLQRLTSIGKVELIRYVEFDMIFLTPMDQIGRASCILYNQLK